MKHAKHDPIPKSYVYGFTIVSIIILVFFGIAIRGELTKTKASKIDQVSQSNNKKSKVKTRNLDDELASLSKAFKYSSAKSNEDKKSVDNDDKSKSIKNSKENKMNSRKSSSEYSSKYKYSKSSESKTSVSVTPTPPTEKEVEDVPDINESIVVSDYFMLMNKYRVANGLNELELIQDLMNVADERNSSELKIIDNKKDDKEIDRIIADNHDIESIKSLSDLGPGKYGEIIKISDFKGDSKALATEFLNKILQSSSDKELLINTDFTKTGISVLKLKNDKYLLVQEFYGE